MPLRKPKQRGIVLPGCYPPGDGRRTGRLYTAKDEDPLSVMSVTSKTCLLVNPNTKCFKLLFHGVEDQGFGVRLGFSQLLFQ